MVKAMDFDSIIEGSNPSGPAIILAGMAELVDAQDLGSCTERCAGSIPVTRTIRFLMAIFSHFFMQKDNLGQKRGHFCEIKHLINYYHKSQKRVDYSTPKNDLTFLLFKPKLLKYLDNLSFVSWLL